MNISRQASINAQRNSLIPNRNSQASSLSLKSSLSERLISLFTNPVVKNFRDVSKK